MIFVFFPFLDVAEAVSEAVRGVQNSSRWLLRRLEKRQQATRSLQLRAACCVS
jgi:hypothetical protein